MTYGNYIVSYNENVVHFINFDNKEIDLEIKGYNILIFLDKSLKAINILYNDQDRNLKLIQITSQTVR